MAITDPRGYRDASWSARLASLLPTLVAVLVCAWLMSWIQFSFKGLEDGDSYFHTRAARELDRQGIHRTFPQTVFSTWSTRYSDKDWLFHVFLIPFQRLTRSILGSDSGPSAREDLVTPGKWAMAALYLAFFSAFAACLCANRARHPWLWLLLYVAMDRHVLYRLLPVRPGNLAVPLLLIEVVLVLRRNGPGLAAMGALHAYAHSSFFLAPLTAGTAFAARFLRREPLPARLLGWSVVGPLAALIAHPYFPNDLVIAWQQLVGVANNVWLGANTIPAELFGEELLGISSSVFMSLMPGVAPAVGGLLAFLSGPRRLSTDGLALTLLAVLLLAAGFLSFRFLDFFLPVAIVLAARLWSELLGTESLRALARGDARSFALAVALLALCLVGALSKRSLLVVHQEFAGATTAHERQRPAVEFLKTAARPDEIVYHNFWYEFAVLYHFRPDGRYIEALDPIYFQQFDSERFAKSVAIMNGSAEDVHDLIANDFGARWVFVTKYFLFERMAAALSLDPRFRKVFEDEEAMVFRVE